ncbi:MAG: hypothetical protein QXP58_09080 [Thermoprotei archaeon]
MLLDTPIDYKLPQDRYAERILRIIQDRERSFERTFTTDVYIELSGKKKYEVKSTNTLKHERTDKSIEYLKSLNFIEKIQDDKDKRRVELRTRPKQIYVTMIKSDPMLFWELIEKGYFYFLFNYEPMKNETICPKCRNGGTLTISKSSKKVSRYKVRDDLHIDVILNHILIDFVCDCDYTYREEIDTINPEAMEDFSKLYDAANERRNLL